MPRKSMGMKYGKVYKNAGHGRTRGVKSTGASAPSTVTSPGDMGMTKRSSKAQSTSPGSNRVTPNRGMNTQVADFKASGLTGKAFGQAVSAAAKQRGPASASTKATRVGAQKSPRAKPATTVRGGTAKKLAATAVAKGNQRTRAKKAKP